MTDDLPDLFRRLEAMPAVLEAAAAALGRPRWREGPPGGFCLVEQAWHLADLEREGYGVRIARMLAEENPGLENFDGEQVARDRNYQDKDVARGIAAFTHAREANLQALRHALPAEWDRSGSQQGVGRVTLADIPRMMAEHDRSHGDEIADLIGLVRGAPCTGKPHGKSAVA